MGEEGVGKSTLLRAMAGILPSEFRVSGDVQVKVPTYCDQFVDTCWFKTDPYEYLFKKLPSDEFDIANWNRYTEVASFFAKMNLDIDKFFSEGKVVGQLSGGELKKLQIAKALLRSTSVLLLDEPTNHLDLKTIVWLEDVVKNFDGTVVLVSHDETFLDHTSSHILYMQHKKGQKPLYRLSGNGYKSFIEEFKSEAERTKQRAEEFDRNQKKIKREVIEAKEKALSRFKKAEPEGAADKGRIRRGMAKSIQNISQRSDRILGEAERPNVVEVDQQIVFPFMEDCVVPNGKVIFDFYLPQLKVGERVLSQDIKIQLIGPEKVVLTGDNGIGKTSLLGEILKSLDLNLKVGYVQQDYYSIVGNSDDTPAHFLLRKGYNLTDVKTTLARLNISRDDMDKPLSILSGGQLCKTLMADILLGKPEVLFLDEPTNNLYPLSNMAFRLFLRKFPGAAFIISHDRSLIKEVASRVIRLTPNGIENVHIY